MRPYARTLLDFIEFSSYSEKNAPASSTPCDASEVKQRTSPDVASPGCTTAFVRRLAPLALALLTLLPLTACAADGGNPHPASVRSTTVATTMPVARSSPSPRASTAEANAPTCRLDRLAVHPGQAEGETGNWIQSVDVHNAGSACQLPAGAFSVSGKEARAGNEPGAAFALKSGETRTLYILAGVECADGSPNIQVHDTTWLRFGSGAGARRVARFPALLCAGPFIDPR